jgi:hypothetical protein
MTDQEELAAERDQEQAHRAFSEAVAGALNSPVQVAAIFEGGLEYEGYSPVTVKRGEDLAGGGSVGFPECTGRGATIVGWEIFGHKIRIEPELTVALGDRPGFRMLLTNMAGEPISLEFRAAVARVRNLASRIGTALEAAWRVGSLGVEYSFTEIFAALRSVAVMLEVEERVLPDYTHAANLVQFVTGVSVTPDNCSANVEPFAADPEDEED